MYDRADEIRSFIPEEYWTISAFVTDTSKMNLKQSFTETEVENRTLKAEKMRTEFFKPLEGSDFIVKEVKKKRENKKTVSAFYNEYFAAGASEVS